MFRPRQLAVKEFLKDRSQAPFYKKRKLGKIEELNYFCRTTANHGFAHVVDDDEVKCLRVMWALVVVTLGIILIVLVYKNVASLVSGSLTTEFLERDGNEDGTGMLLPDIHICDPSIFSAKRLLDLGLNDTMATYLTLATSRSADLVSYWKKHPKLKRQLKGELDEILANRSLTMSELIAQTALTCRDIVNYCTKEDETYKSEKCCNLFFSPETYISIFGSCITTHGKPMRQSYVSRDAGFVVYITPNMDDVIIFNRSFIKRDYILQKGTFYAVSSPADHIETILHRSGRFAMPNTWVSLPISKTVIDNSELRGNYLAPYDCVATNDLAYRMSNTPEYDFYTAENCQAAFQQQVYRQNRNCSAIFYNYKIGKANLTTELCEPNTILTLNASLFEKIPKNQCPIECIKEIFHLSPSYAAFNNEYLEHVNQGKNITVPDHVVLHFFYSSFDYRVEVIHVNTLLKFLGDVGGNLGLFLGASLISIMEIIAFLVRCLLRLDR